LQTALALQAENRQLGSTVSNELKARGIAPFRWSEELLTFYRETTAFLFESLVWNRSVQKQSMQRWIIRYLRARLERGCRVLIYGDGLGFDSAALAMAGHDVTYFEVSKKSMGFARQLFDNLGCRVRMLDDPMAMEQESFDVVVCLDVLEHVPNPVETVRSIQNYMCQGGCLIVHAPFWYLAASVGTHLVSNLRYSGSIQSLYGIHGLHAIESSWFWAPIVLTSTKNREQRKSITSLRLLVGGLVLRSARIWSEPHAILIKWILKKSLRDWTELESYVQTLQSESDRTTGNNRV
jgi:SAM-dependent methyltransferase